MDADDVDAHASIDTEQPAEETLDDILVGLIPETKVVIREPVVSSHAAIESGVDVSGDIVDRISKLLPLQRCKVTAQAVLMSAILVSTMSALDMFTELSNDPARLTATLLAHAEHHKRSNYARSHVDTFEKDLQPDIKRWQEQFRTYDIQEYSLVHLAHLDALHANRACLPQNLQDSFSQLHKLFCNVEERLREGNLLFADPRVSESEPGVKSHTFRNKIPGLVGVPHKRAYEHGIEISHDGVSEFRFHEFEDSADEMGCRLHHPRRVPKINSVYTKRGAGDTSTQNPYFPIDDHIIGQLEDWGGSTQMTRSRAGPRPCAVYADGEGIALDQTLTASSKQALDTNAGLPPRPYLGMCLNSQFAEYEIQLNDGAVIFRLLPDDCEVLMARLLPVNRAAARKWDQKGRGEFQFQWDVKTDHSTSPIWAYEIVAKLKEGKRLTLRPGHDIETQDDEWRTMAESLARASNFGPVCINDGIISRGSFVYERWTSYSPTQRQRLRSLLYSRPPC